MNADEDRNEFQEGGLDDEFEGTGCRNGAMKQRDPFMSALHARPSPAKASCASLPLFADLLISAAVALSGRGMFMDFHLCSSAFICGSKRDTAS
jgi:hypothetical protein